MAERDVIYRLKVLYDQGGSQAFAAMASSHAAALKTMEDRWKAFDEAMKTAAGNQTETSRRSYGKQKDHAKEYYDYLASENKKLADAIKARERAEELARRTQERAYAQARAGNAMMREGLMNTAEGVTRVARGLALMGFVNDENLEKLLKTLAVVQGTADIVMGSAKAYTAMQKAVDGYAMSVNAARAAEAARAGGAAAGAAGGAGVGLGGMLAGSVAAAAAIGAVTLALVELAEIADGTAGERGSVTAAIGRYMESIGVGIGGTTPYTDAYNADEQTKRFQRRSDTQRQNQGRIENESRADRELEAAREANRRGLANSRFGNTAFGDEGAFFGGAGDKYRAEMERMRGRAGGFAASARGINPDDPSLRPGAIHDYEQAIDAENELVRLAKEKADHELRASQISQAYHRDAISSAQQELAILRQQHDAATGRLESARDRFGMMNPMEQSRALRLGKMANEANALRAAGRGEDASRIESRFTRDDLGLIRGIGTEGTDAFGGRVAGARADAAGFSGVFGGEERKRASEITSRIETLVAEKTLNVEASVKLEINDDQIRRVLQDSFNKGNERIKQLADEVAGLRSRVELSQRNAGLSAAGIKKGG